MQARHFQEGVEEYGCGLMYDHSEFRNNMMCKMETESNSGQNTDSAYTGVLEKETSMLMNTLTKLIPTSSRIGSRL